MLDSVGEEQLSVVESVCNNSALYVESDRVRPVVEPVRGKKFVLDAESGSEERSNFGTESACAESVRGVELRSLLSVAESVLENSLLGVVFWREMSVLVAESTCVVSDRIE